MAWGNLGGLTTFAMESTVIFLCTLYLQQVRGYSPMTAGLIFGVLGLAVDAGVVLAVALLIAVFLGRVKAFNNEK